MTGRVLAPVEGDPACVRELARALRSGAGRLAQVNGVLTRIKAGASWDSPAGEVFEAAVQQSPPVVDALIDRYAGAALALMTFADSLEAVQHRARAASESHQDALHEYRMLEELAVTVTADPVAAEAVRRRQGETMGRVMEAERRHARAWEDFRDADRYLARRLLALADDVLDDSWHYSAFARAEGFAEELAAVPPALRRTSVTAALGTVADVVGTASQVGLLVLYGEGSWKQVGINAGARTLGLGAHGLKGGALAGSRATSSLADARRGYVGESLTARERVVIGTRDELHRVHPRLARTLDGAVPPSRMVVPLDPLPVMPATTNLPLGRKAQVWRAQAGALARRRVDEAFLDDWRAATAGGAGARRMFVAGVTLEHAVPPARSAAAAAVTDGEPERSGLPR
ncbi:putative T7SS-secreted protein [Knoellia aerolata]|uniref:Uncharacterized protein n=1 Tax=Knoellia aerolata DSM 18566 TaxID=1385519 RepID=A0A0A0JYG8_9MICO|nr:hypothetical protein [Knoellia aerolata]KGN41784.1 hypothetical protein N801_04455 [Knoellia aerolata DSM 18566]